MADPVSRGRALKERMRAKTEDYCTTFRTVGAKKGGTDHELSEISLKSPLIIIIIIYIYIYIYFYFVLACHLYFLL